MKKNIFLFLIAVFALFISACGIEEEEEGIFAGQKCSQEGVEYCSDNGMDLLICQSSTWTIEKQCNISIGKQCGQNSAGVFGCFGGEVYDEEFPDPETSDTENEIPDTNDTSDTENETPDGDTISEDPADTDDSDDKPQTDQEPDDPTGPDDTEITDNDTENVPDNENNDEDTEQPAGQCSSNADCSGTTPATPYCSISTSECIANAVFITEYVEGSSYNKAIEIYNGSKSAVNLSNFTIQQANNGKNWGSDANYVFNFPAASISSGQTFVFCNAASDPELVAKCDQTPTSAVFNFNGDDGIALFDGNSIVDQIGIQGNNPVSAWSVAGVPSATEAHTLRRKLSVIQGTTDWALSAGTTEENSEWEVLAKDTFDGLKLR